MDGQYVTAKPHKGTVENWIKWPTSQKNCGLGYMIVGDSIGHPQYDGIAIRTSYVVKHEGDEIETKNSRYTLGRPAIDADKGDSGSAI